MALIISPSSPSTTLPSSWPSESNTPVRDVSFSSYLTTSEENYIRSSAHHHRKKPEDGHEIDIFGAEKYFNQSIHGPPKSTAANFKQYYNMKDQTKDAKVQQPRTPSCHSSESSWNSQSSLLKRVQRPPSRGTIRTATNSDSNNNKAQGRKLFVLPCYCCDENSIVVGEQQADIKNVGKITDPDFVFPVVDTADTEGRKSLEVFGSSELLNNIIGSKSFSLEKRLNMLSWDNLSVGAGAGAPSESYRDSDASSDLFELDCLSCNANPIGSGPPCYAPSEASIEWSVVTASAADFSEDQRSTTLKKVPQKSKPRGTALLLGCKSQKAVGVLAGEVHKTVLPANRKAVVNNEQLKKTGIKSKYSEEYVISTSMSSRFKAESTKLQGKNKLRQERSPTWSHSSHASDLLYIH